MVLPDAGSDAEDAAFAGGSSGSGGGAAGSQGFGGSGGGAAGSQGFGGSAGSAGSASDSGMSPRCPNDMVDRGDHCIDLYEAPNVAGGLPLVMYTFIEAESWCESRDKRLCFDDEWTDACGNDLDQKYPYGNERVPGVCTDDKLWRLYEQSQLNNWPVNLPTDGFASLQQLMAAVKSTSQPAASAAAHVEWLYQADPSGSRPQCVGGGAFDLTGNVEEWTRRRDGGEPNLHGNLKGRYWADTRTCQNNIVTHGDSFRFYEIGFRCCKDAPSADQ